MDGKLQWEKDFGDMDIQGAFGEGSSPALHGNTVVINWDHQGESFITALDKRTGKELWKTPRNEGTTWTTPLIVEVNGKAQAIVAGPFTRAYDLETGTEVWNCEGLTGGVIPTAVVQNNMVYVTSSSRGSGVLMAIHLEKAKGTIAYTDAVAWWTEQDAPHIPSPLVMNENIYMLKNRNGILSALNAKTGKVIYGPQRLDGIQGMYASPVGIKDRIYFASQDGVTLVIKHGAQYEVLASNTLDDSFNASPVIVGNELYLRGQRHLYCIASD
jgi:outer membrane protein assembly factor BamB